MVNSSKSPIRFLYKNEITERANYHAALAAERSDLSHIVGIFNLNKNDAFRCGLNNCGQEHWNGIVIATIHGLETHCGLDCGAREFPDDFKDKHALFRNALRHADSIRTVKELKERSAGYIDRASTAKKSIDSMYADLQAIRSALRSPLVVNRHIETIIRTDGVIERPVALTDTEKAMSGGKQKFRMEVVGKIDGITALRDFAKASVEIDEVIKLLRKTQALRPESASTRVINQYVRLNNNIEADIATARMFIGEAQRFLAPENLAEVKKISLLDGVREVDLQETFFKIGWSIGRRKQASPLSSVAS